jgi:hypothetical protein
MSKTYAEEGENTRHTIKMAFRFRKLKLVIVILAMESCGFLFPIKV